MSSQQTKWIRADLFAKVINVQELGCPRCSSEHQATFKEFHKTFLVGEQYLYFSYTFTHYGYCYFVQEPILMRVDAAMISIDKYAETEIYIA